MGRKINLWDFFSNISEDIFRHISFILGQTTYFFPGLCFLICKMKGFHSVLTNFHFSPVVFLLSSHVLAIPKRGLFFPSKLYSRILNFSNTLQFGRKIQVFFFFLFCIDKMYELSKKNLKIWWSLIIHRNKSLQS